VTAMFKVQSGVPMPDIERSKPPRRKWPVEEMQPGDFFFVPGRASRNVSAYVSRITKDLPGTFSARHIWAWEDKRNGSWHPCAPSASGAIEGVGVWRTE
jgi:hypothetical protein